MAQSGPDRAQEDMLVSEISFFKLEKINPTKTVLSVVGNVRLFNLLHFQWGVVPWDRARWGPNAIPYFTIAHLYATMVRQSVWRLLSSLIGC